MDATIIVAKDEGLTKEPDESIADELIRVSPSEKADDDAQATTGGNESSPEGSIEMRLKGLDEKTSEETAPRGEKQAIFTTSTRNLDERHRSTRSSKDPSLGEFSNKSSRSFRASFVQSTSRRVHGMRASFTRSSGSVADLARLLAASSVTDPDLLGSFQCSAIVVNYISAGYILLPYGEFLFFILPKL
jgi:hypothetical protein